MGDRSLFKLGELSAALARGRASELPGKVAQHFTSLSYAEMPRQYIAQQAAQQSAAPIFHAIGAVFAIGYTIDYNFHLWYEARGLH
jgi:hypothetical protein